MTLGCRVNQYESSALAEELYKDGLALGNFSEKCDVYIINTCAVTEESVRKSRQMVRRAIKKNSYAFVGVMGCATQLEATNFSKIEGISFICGTRNKHEMLDAVRDFIKNGKNERCVVSVPYPDGELHKTLSLSSERARAYIKIEDGCNGKCSYCVIPSLRGNIVTRNEEEIVKEAELIAEKGCSEVVLTGIETAAYGDGLAELISKIDKIKGIERIRVGSLEPSFMKPRFIDKISDIESFCHHFHLSVQNGSDKILALMRRKYNTEIMERNIDYIKKKIPDVNFSADVIVGFPGETEEDFINTCSFVKRVGFLHLHIFTYSKRPGNEAAKMDGQIPEETKNKRLHILEAIAREEKEKILSAMISEVKPVKILVETKNGEYFVGHTENFVECGIPLSCFGCDSETIKGKIIEALPQRIEGGILICQKTE